MPAQDPSRKPGQPNDDIPFALLVPSSEELLSKDHTLNGGILFGLDGYIVEIQARAMSVLKKPTPWRTANSAARPAVKISGMARGAIQESLDRIAGSFSKIGIPDTDVEILVNLVPADLLKEGTWLDLPLAIILLQAAGKLPHLPEHHQGDYILLGELGIHGEIRRVPGVLSLAMRAKPGQKLIVPSGNEKECALILAKPGHENCGIYPVSLLVEVVEFFQGKRKLDNVFKQGGIKFDDAVAKAPDFGLIRGQELAKEAAFICAAGGHNLLLQTAAQGRKLLVPNR